MKIISLGLISSILFSIVLAKNSSESESTTGCFPFCRKKTKKGHKTADELVEGKDEYNPDLPNLKFIEEFEPMTLEGCKGRLKELDDPFVSETDGMIIDEVTGFSRRKNDSVLSGWYVRPYEEDYDHMIKLNFIPLSEYYQRKQKNAHKQSGTYTPICRMSEKQEINTIHENDSNILHEDKENENKIEEKDELEEKSIAQLFPEDREDDKKIKEIVRRLYRVWKKDKAEIDKTEMKKMEEKKMKKIERKKKMTKLMNKIKCWN
ncbi:erythrocyte membrane antigen 1 [Plasmodium chabaudi chabaudi]|uniref:Erythrocyte membrane antigen 1 n=1 Tax=Plasmodium chabaudi chabaudi TaxID=31271 RepID=A0A4V0K5F6_PLACU|nr:erythrocyte membrane antigen 1 [Plasmodium chabaudi chabaudi]VTZ68193.1 erythrocyte membrane antigen 1 [Plasmodium chabaudi chabaudi]|eukprot:XP_744217.2 erythrocyte membrane antigen 1 [Plasmodium chabaudi chabaudi]